MIRLWRRFLCLIGYHGERVNVPWGIGYLIYDCPYCGHREIIDLLGILPEDEITQEDPLL